jgi:ketosteroid isomerase-like protein
MGRTPQDIMTDHLAAVASGDPDAVAADYADDAVLVTVDGVRTGRAAVRDFFAGALAAVGDAEFSMGAMVFTGDAALITWGATSPRARVTDGVDTLVFDGDRIRLQTTVFRLEISPP